MRKTLRLRVMTPAETLLEVEDAAWVQIQLADGGGLSVYPGHAPLLAETVTAPLHYADAQGEHRFEAEAGLLSIDGDGVTVLTRGQPSERPTSAAAAADNDRRFDRLARELLDTLGKETATVLSVDDERA